MKEIRQYIECELLAPDAAINKYGHRQLISLMGKTCKKYFGFARFYFEPRHK